MFLYGIGRGAGEAMADGRPYLDSGHRDDRVVIKECIDQMRDVFADEVPAGSSMRVVEPISPYWFILLGEFAAIHRVRLVEPDAPADYAVAVFEEPSGPFCVRMVVEELS
jgi:hypothetical protein